MITLKEWRKSEGITQVSLANALAFLLQRPILQTHIRSWESGVMPRADTGEAITYLTKGKVKFWKGKK